MASSPYVLSAVSQVPQGAERTDKRIIPRLSITGAGRVRRTRREGCGSLFRRLYSSLELSLASALRIRASRPIAWMSAIVNSNDWAMSASKAASTWVAIASS
jgi:hypothetical protein